MKWLLIAGIALACLVAVVVVTGMLLPKAHVATRGAHLKHPPEAVWALITGDQTWRPDVRRYEPLSSKMGAEHGRRPTSTAAPSRSKPWNRSNRSAW
jgi:hypothetical protein